MAVTLSSLSLPQVKITFWHEARVRQVIVLGGRAPDASWLRGAASGKDVWAADHGADACKAAGITPSRALGDFDSLGKGGKEWLERAGVKIERYPKDKDYTDFQLCLSRSEGDLLVTGCWGGRFDHAFANVFSALWNETPRKKGQWSAKVCAFADELELLVPLGSGSRGRETEKAALELEFWTRPSVLSLLPLTALCRGVGLHGTKWELEGSELTQGRPCAVSNVPLKDRVTVEIGEGQVGIYCFFGNVQAFP